MRLYVVKTFSLHSKVRSLFCLNTSFDLYAEMTEVFLTCIVLNIGPHDFFNSLCSIRLFMDYMIFVYQVSKSMQVMLRRLFVLLLLLFLKRVLKSLSARMPSGPPQLSWRVECSCASQRVLQCPVSPASSGGICCPGLDTAAHPTVHKKCQLPQLRFRTGSAPSGQRAKLAFRHCWGTCLF